jgi:hypothetical protein
MCARLDALKQRAAAGDERALEILLHLVPRDLPPGALRGRRDDEIRRLAAELRSAHPGMTVRGAAMLLAPAGQMIAAGRELSGGSFDTMLSVERDHLAAGIADILAWAPVTKTGECWPRLRSIIAIISG